MAQALALIAPDMALVDRLIQQKLSSDVPLVSQVSQYIVAAGGKRLRPVLLLLMAGALGWRGEQRVNLAAIVEFIHTATLLHDDVVDESSLRRGRPTANHAFGNAASVLVGDFLYSRAFQMMVDARNMRVMEILADATNVIAEGEVLQLMNMHNADVSEEAYLRVIRSKTAKLFEASARLPAVMQDASAEMEAACATYGQAIGTAFQVIDDVLDYEGDAAALGKNIGDDLREGKVTLPVIVAMQLGTPAEQALIRHCIETGVAEEDSEAELAGRLHQIAAVVSRTGAIEVARAAAQAEAQRAQACALALPHNAYGGALVQLAAQLLARNT
jgi:octaprenyl-diphosphate synthase